MIWNIPSDAVPGTYRIQHLGYHKEMLSGKYCIAGNFGEVFNLANSVKVAK